MESQPPQRWLVGAATGILLTSVVVAAWGLAAPLDLPPLSANRALLTPAKVAPSPIVTIEDLAPIWRFEEPPAQAPSSEPEPSVAEPVVEEPRRPLVEVVGIAHDVTASYAFVRTNGVVQVKQKRDTIAGCEVVAVAVDHVRLRDDRGEWTVALPRWENAP